MQACLCVEKKSCQERWRKQFFHHCGGPVKPIKNDRESSFREDQFKCQERTSEARAGLIDKPVKPKF